MLILVFQLFSSFNYLNGYLVMYRLDFEYLKDLPVLVLDVNEDFKNDRIKQEGAIDKVRMVLRTKDVIKELVPQKRKFVHPLVDPRV